MGPRIVRGEDQTEPLAIRKRPASRRYDRRTTVRTRQDCLDEFSVVAAKLAVKYGLIGLEEDADVAA